MELRNPFLVVLIAILLLPLITAYYNDGELQPQRVYDFWFTFFACLIHFWLIIMVAQWASTH